MELKTFTNAPEFLDNLVTAPFEVAGGSVDIVVNIEAFCDSFWRRAGARIRESYQPKRQPEKKASARSKSRSKQAPVEPVINTIFDASAGPFELLALEDEQERKMFVDLLLTPGLDGQSPVLAGWGMTVNGEHVKPSHEILMGMPTRGVRELWFFCRRQSETVKKLGTRPTKASRTTSETTGDGSSTPD